MKRCNGLIVYWVLIYKAVKPDRDKKQTQIHFEVVGIIYVVT